jgi:hypothetical protein
MLLRVVEVLLLVPLPWDPALRCRVLLLCDWWLELEWLELFSLLPDLARDEGDAGPKSERQKCKKNGFHALALRRQPEKSHAKE